MTILGVRIECPDCGGANTEAAINVDGKMIPGWRWCVGCRTTYTSDDEIDPLTTVAQQKIAWSS